MLGLAQSLELRICKQRDEALGLLKEPLGPSGLLTWESSSESIPLALSDPQRLSQPCISAAISALLLLSHAPAAPRHEEVERVRCSAASPKGFLLLAV